VTAGLSDSEDALFRALRGCRLNLARERGVPSYVIFHDRTLLEMAQRRPASLDEMRGISGVGDKKLNEYGEHFLEVIAESDFATGT
jgi:ATP-dependent DNA helicase RecQ